MSKYLVNFARELKKKLVPSLLCFGIIISLYYLTFSHYKTFGRSQDIIFSLETKLLDLRFLTRGPQKPKANVGILAIDEKAIKRFGRFPFSRRYYAKAFENLKKLGVNWIGFDAIFSEPEKMGIDDIKPLLADLNKSSKAQLSNNLAQTMRSFERFSEVSPGDYAFRQGISKFGSVVMGYFYYGLEPEVKAAGREATRFSGLEEMAETSQIYAVILPEGKELSDYPALKIPGMLANTPFISQASSHYGFFSNDPDIDAVSRWVTLVRNLDGKLMPSLSLKVAAEALNRDIAVFFDDRGVESISLVNRENDSDTLDIPTDPDGFGRILLNHRGPGKIFQHFSLADAYDNTFSEIEKKKLKGANLLLGATQIGGNDQRPNPFDPALDGVENHAAVIDNILSRDFVKRPANIYALELYIILILGIVFSPIMMFSRAMYSGLAVLTFLTGYYLLDRFYIFGHKGIWAYMGVPFIEIIALFITSTLYKYMTEEREKKKVRGVFSHYLSPEVISQVLEDPAALKLGGEKKELTVFFSDVRGFTTISETLTPEKLCELMNDYFTPMTGIILKSGGVLDKYIGDAIMAFWGAPVHYDNHADRAAHSCIQMLYAMDQLKIDFMAKGLPPIDVGMGLNTGPMAVGNMGSGERFCYTVMGDAVNLGARLEGLTKEYTVKLLISEYTHAKLTPGAFFTRDLDDIRVKGKNEPVKIFEIMRPDILNKTERIIELTETFAAGRGAYLAKNWEEAEKFFMACLAIRADDGPSQLYLERIGQYKNQHPGDNWDGVYTFTHK